MELKLGRLVDGLYTSLLVEVLGTSPHFQAQEFIKIPGPQTIRISPSGGFKLGNSEVLTPVRGIGMHFFSFGGDQCQGRWTNWQTLSEHTLLIPLCRGKKGGGDGSPLLTPLDMYSLALLWPNPPAPSPPPPNPTARAVILVFWEKTR